MFKIFNSIIQSITAFLLYFEAFRRGSIVKTQTVLQIETVECGAASLAMVLLHYGRYVPLTQLREICGVSRDGSDASSLVKAARSLGLEAVGYKKSIASLAKMKMPLILFWDFNHFLILEGFSSTTAYLNDPAFGRRKVSLAEFDISYTGVAIAMQPTPSFKKGGIKPSFWPIVFRRLATEPFAALFILIAGLVLIVPNLFMPIFQQIYMDEIIGNNFTNWIKPLLWGLAIIILFQSAVKQLELIATRLLEKRLTRKFSAFYEHHILSLPERFYAQRFGAEISSRMALNADVSEFISTKFLPLLSSSLLLVFYLILTLFYSPILGLIVFITTGINAFFVTVTLNIQKDANLKIQKDKAKSGNALIGAIQQIETVKASAVEQDVLRRYMGYETRLLNNTQELGILNAKLKVVPSALNTFNEIAILIVGFILIIKGQLTVGMLLASQTIANSLKEKIEKVIGFVQSLPAFEAKIIMLEDIIEQDLDPIYSAPSFIGWSGNRDRLSGQIQIDNLSFGYVPIKPPLIQNFSLTINPGDRIAFVGGSGSGKSTMSKIVAGLYTPTEGKVLYDGHMLCDIPRSVAVSSLAMVSQEIQLYACSVRDNLTLWNPSINYDEIVHACEEAQILDTILALPDGFNSILKEGAYDLSGGQRQRMEIARALIQNPSILVLDEATSALDSASEQKVVQAFNRRGCTQIIVAHRLSTIRDSDLIVVMEKGVLVQQGIHDEMVKQDGSPYQLLLNESGLN